MDEEQLFRSKIRKGEGILGVIKERLLSSEWNREMICEDLVGQGKTTNAAWKLINAVAIELMAIIMS